MVVSLVLASQLWNSPWLWRLGGLIGLTTATAAHDIADARCNGGDNDQLTIAAVLRNEGQGWFAISDAGHRPLNLKRVETQAGEIAVHFAFEAKKVLSFVVTPDETLAGQGYFAGASVGLNSATIRLSSASVLGTGERSPLGVADRSANLWVFGLFEGSCPV